MDVIEAAYNVEAPEQDWLAGLVDAASPMLDSGMGTLAYTYDAAAVPMRVHSAEIRGASLTFKELGGALASANGDYVAETWRTKALATASEIPGYDDLPAVQEYLAPRGIRDVLAVNACDVSGLGVWLGAPLPAAMRLDSRDRATWSRVCAHMAAAFRLRRSLHGEGATPETAEAVLTPTGDLEHAEGEAKLASSREALRRAAASLERIRSEARGAPSHAAVEQWRVLARARWSLVDYFERDGRRYVLAMQNASAVHGPEILTEREKQVVAHAAMGHANKVIAYELGIADSTVRVLVARASEKLCVKSRRELVAVYRAYLAAGRA